MTRLNWLSLVTKAILEKYKDAPFEDNKALLNYTNQAMNRDVKGLFIHETLH